MKQVTTKFLSEKYGKSYQYINDMMSRYVFAPYRLPCFTNRHLYKYDSTLDKMIKYYIENKKDRRYSYDCITEV